MVSKIYVGSTEGDLTRNLEKAFAYVGIFDALSDARAVFVKPNFTFPRPVPGVTTTRAVLEASLTLLTSRGVDVYVGESNGGYGSFLAREAFEGHQLHEICLLTGAKALDLSSLPTEVFTERIDGKRVTVRLPKMLVEDVDFTISIPVLKVHAMTTVSLSMKNLWGCYPTDLRLLEHKDLDRKLVLISKLIKARFGIVDATYGLDKHGPMEGEARYLGKFIASNDLLALDTACARMMGFDPDKILHLRNLTRYASLSASSVATSNEDLSKQDWGFTLQRDFIDSLSFACFHSDYLSKIVFDSPLTVPIYALLGRKPRRKLA